MAVQIEVAGKVSVGYNSQTLGYSRDGVTIRFDPAFLEVMSDDYGGASGKPADRQILGCEANIVCELVKYDRTQVHALTSYIAGGTAFTLPALGTLMRQGSHTANLVLTGDSETWTIGDAQVIGSHEFNKGSRFSTWVISFVGYINNTTSRQFASVS